MSRQAIAAVLARDDLASGERLVALSLASFADRENRAWPGAPAAAARAGLRRSRYLEAREHLVARGLVVVNERASGRGRSSVVSLAFAEVGPWWDGEINVELFEAVLSYCATSGSPRLLLATMAALADERGTVQDLSTEQLCAAAGMTDRTYRRARQALIPSGELVVVSGAGGRGNTNVWRVLDPRQRDGAAPVRVARRVLPPVGARPIVGTARPAEAAEPRSARENQLGEKGGQDGSVSGEKGSVLTGVSAVKGGQDRTVAGGKGPVLTGVSGRKGGQDRTLFELPSTVTPAERAAQTPAETPAPNVRAGKEPQNPRTPEDPPSPPAGGSPPDSIVIEQTYVTERGRKRRRAVRIDLDEVRRGLGLPTSNDCAAWEQIRALLLDAVGQSTFEIWLEPIELIAIDDTRTLVLVAPDQTASWVRERFGRLLSRCAERAGLGWRLASEPERRALDGQDRQEPDAVRGR